jgi:hypothetical protein
MIQTPIVITTTSLEDKIKIVAIIMEEDHLEVGVTIMDRMGVTIMALPRVHHRTVVVEEEVVPAHHHHHTVVEEIKPIVIIMPKVARVHHPIMEEEIKATTTVAIITMPKVEVVLPTRERQIHPTILDTILPPLILQLP